MDQFNPREYLTEPLKTDEPSPSPIYRKTMKGETLYWQDENNPNNKLKEKLIYRDNDELNN